MSFSIAGKTAIITGAANGVGLAIARHFAEEGANVMCADIDEAALVSELGELADREGSSVSYFAGDLREKLTVANLVVGYNGCLRRCRYSGECLASGRADNRSVECQG